MQLRQEGLFDPARKKRLPFLPHVIGLITGERSDAERDVHRNAELEGCALEAVAGLDLIELGSGRFGHGEDSRPQIRHRPGKARDIRRPTLAA